MKMSKQRYNLLLNVIRAVVENHGPARVRWIFSQQNTPSRRWALLNAAVHQLQYSDRHPFFKNGTWVRIYPHDPDFQLYKDGDQTLHDGHIDTALRRTVQELGLCPEGSYAPT